ncbi:tumor suppressor, Mitostatin-domain-containing protein [Gaertneriomyces semiglobifer]|nr:tumor suppressor, Mitostatin-domain-containing protein [Gaertneriomyces semiglobifer]
MTSAQPITILTRDLVRTLRPHSPTHHREGSEAPANQPRSVVIGSDQLRKIQGVAKNAVMKAEEYELAARQSRLEKVAILEAARERKLRMQQMDTSRANNAKLNDIEAEAKAQSRHLLAKAQAQLEEQEDEIKRMNELMLYAKCVAIRDRQVAEREIIRKERHEEEARLDAIMETERQNELRRLEEKEKTRLAELRRGAATIRSQIAERREASLLEAERRDQETKISIAKMQALAEQEAREKAARIEAQKALMVQVARANQESCERRRLAKEKEIDEDKKVLEYLLEKEKREIESDKLMKAKKAEREMELARLRAAQEKMSDKQAQQDALRARRAFEAHEREYRQKLKLAAEKKSLAEASLRETRATQQRARERAIALEARKMREEFLENMRAQKEAESKVKLEEGKQAERRKQYAKELKDQIEEKETLVRQARNEFFMEGARLSKERREKAEHLEQIKLRKLEELRSLGIPEKYYREIERKVGVQNRGAAITTQMSNS